MTQPGEIRVNLHQLLKAMVDRVVDELAADIDLSAVSQGFQVLLAGPHAFLPIRPAVGRRAASEEARNGLKICLIDIRNS